MVDTRTRRRMFPLNISGLIGPGDRKSVQPMAAQLAPGEYDQLHHFVTDGVWDAAPLEAELLLQADRLVGGKDAVLVIDDTAMPKKGDRSVGVAPQYARLSARRPIAKHWWSLTLARGEVPVMVALHRHTLMIMIAYALLQSRRLKAAGRKKRITGPPPQSSMPAIRQAILDLFARPSPRRRPHCDMFLADIARPKGLES